MTCTFSLLTVGLVVALARSPVAQAQDTLQMTQLQELALRTDPRTAQFDLLRRASELRRAAIGSERLPQLSLNGWASHQSDVTRPSLNVPGAVFPDLPRDRWQSTLDVDQLLYDGGNTSRRRELERARYAESAAEVNVALYGLRSEVNSAFFSAFLLQQRSAEYEALVTDLDARLAAVRARVEAGTALRREAAEVEAERVRATLQRDEAQAARRASLAILADLAGRAYRHDGSARAAGRSTGEKSAIDCRPRWRRFAAGPSSSDSSSPELALGQEAALAGTENAPRVSAFGQGGVGLPGLDQFRTTSDAFWQAGVRVEWRPWTWRAEESEGRSPATGAAGAGDRGAGPGPESRSGCGHQSGRHPAPECRPGRRSAGRQPAGGGRAASPLAAR